jgi:hypothetical protein
MTKNQSQHRWPDALVERVLRAPRSEVAAICAETGLNPAQAKRWRGLREKRALRIAVRLGLSARAGTSLGR